MSSIKEMVVQGIRSFGPDYSDRQSIEFFSPLTLILGANGTGKTTVIECLKYVTTGEMPPGGMQAFIHDPKVAGEREVKAKVLLQFKDVRGRHCTARRVLAARQDKKPNTRTVEFEIMRPDEHGNIQSIGGSKCVDINHQMVDFLGVSKAVLNNVIFVHQEEANWVLSEPKVVKTKFDDIFASTRYVKALESILKIKKEQTDQITIFKNDIEHLKANRDTAAKIRQDLDETEASKETVDEEVAKGEPIQQKLNQLRQKQSDIQDLNTTIEKRKSEKKEMKRAQQELKNKIENEFTGSREELQLILSNFEKEVQEKETTLEGVEDQLGDVDREYTMLSREKSNLLLEQGKMEQEAENQSKRITERQGLVKNFAECYEIKGYSGFITDEETVHFNEVLDKKAQEFSDRANVTKAEYEEREVSISTQLEQQKTLKTKLETERKMKRKNMKKNDEDISQIDQELSQVEATGDTLGDVQETLDRTDLELSEAEKSVNLEGLRSEVQQLQKDKAQQDAKLKQLDLEMSRLALESTARAQLELFRKDKTAKEDQRRHTCSKIEESMRKLVGHMPTDNVKKTLDEYNSRLAGSVKTGSDTLRNLWCKLTEKQTQHKMKMEQLTSKETELQECEHRLLEVSSSQNFDEGLDKLQVELKKAQEEEGQLKAEKVLYNKYQGNLEQSDPVCPLCHRRFDTETEVDELIGEIGQKLTLVPDRLERASQKICEKQGQVEQMHQMKPTRAVIKYLSEMHIPKLKTEIGELNEEIQPLEDNIGQKNEKMQTFAEDQKMAQLIQTDVSTIDRFYKEIRDLDRKISAQASKLTVGDSERPMQDVQTEREDLQKQLEVINGNLDHKRQEISEHSERVQRLKADLNELKREKLQIEIDLQKRTRLEENKVELEANKEALDMEVTGSYEQLEPLQGKIDDSSAEKQSISKQKEAQCKKETEQSRKIEENQKLLKLISSDIDRYVQDGKEQNLKDSRGRMKAMEDRAHDLVQERESLSSKIGKLKEELANQKTSKRELEDNMAVYKKEEEIGCVAEQIGELTEKLGGLDVSNLAREQKELERLKGETDMAKGRQVELEVKIQDLKKELIKDMYKNADKKYRDKMIDKRTTEIANKDLDKYYKALERAIIDYHQKKMKEINRTIRKLWGNTYRGNDIESIEIKSDYDKGSGNKRRIYQYRVVMKVANTELDMRGRCSAGQKVLASLIIRLALADTFCRDCGILALDEPTTNLDRENIESLACALVEIIKDRSEQRNFQLLVITHNEDFVERLSQSDYVEEFFKVKKNDNGLSCLMKTRVSDLHSM